MIKLIAVTDSNFGISKNEQIPWAFSDDLRFFRENTLHQVVIMGRKTYFSLPNGPLINRKNCVISTKYKELPGAEVFSTLEAAIFKYHDAWIIGGAEIYNYSLSHQLIQRALITIVNKNYNADKAIDKKLLPTTFTTLYYDTYKIREYIFSY